MAGCEGAAAGHGGGEAGASPRRGEDDSDEVWYRASAAAGHRGVDAGAPPRRGEEHSDKLGDGASAESWKPHPTHAPPLHPISRPMSSSAPAAAAMGVDDAVHKDERQRPSFVDPKEIKKLMKDIEKRKQSLDNWMKKAHEQRPGLDGKIEKVDMGEGGTGGTDVVQSKTNCRHYTDKDTSLLKTNWMETWSSKGATLCDQRQKDGPTGAEKKPTGKKKKGGHTNVTKGLGKDQTKPKGSFWMCLECGKLFCGGRDKVPQGHIRVHFRDNSHLWAANNEDPTSIYCFKCKKEVTISFLDLKLMDTRDKMTTLKVIKNVEDVLSPPSDQMAPSPPSDQTMQPTSCAEKGSHQLLGPSDTELKATPSPVIKTSVDTIARPHKMSGSPALEVSPPVVTSKSAADKEGPVITKGRSGHIVKGLTNYGNTCYFNAVIQSFLALRCMRATILRPDVQTGRLAWLLKEQFLMTEASYGTCNELNIVKLRSAFLFSNPQFNNMIMHDSHECFVSFRASLHQEEVDEWRRAKDASIEDHITISSFIFMGTLCSTVSGKVCTHSSPSETIPFGELLLSIPSKSIEDIDMVDGQVSLDDRLQAYFGQVFLPNWECAECNAGRKDKERIIYRPADQRSYIRRAPIVLTICLGRIVYADNNKVHGHVSFPLVLDILQFMDQRSVDNSNTIYNLVSVIEHSGVSDINGHYISYTKSGSTWFSASDLIVKEVSDKEVLACEAFMLFYERVGHIEPPPALLMKEDQWTLVAVKKKMKTPQLAVPPQQHKPVGRTKILSIIQNPPKNLQRPSPPAAFSSTPVDGDRTFLEVASKLPDEKVVELFDIFLNRNYLCLKQIFNGDVSFPLNISYSDILKYSRQLAMKVCKDYNRLIKKLEAAAINFLKKPNGSDPKVTLKILQRPLRHETWNGHKMRIEILAEAMEVFGHTRSRSKTLPRTKSAIFKPTPEFVLMLEGILRHIISRHKKGFSWGGDFDIEDVDVFNGRIFLIHKPPNKFSDSAELIEAMSKDFLKYAELFLADLMKFVSNGNRDIPYLGIFVAILSSMENYATLWSDEEAAERFRDLLVNHPFLKPSIIRSYLFSGIYAACRAHDSAEFKSALNTECGSARRWISKIKDLDNTVCTAVLEFEVDKNNKRNGQVAEDGKEEEEEEEKEKEKENYTHDLESFAEFMRHLFHHGPDNSKEKRKIVLDSDGNLCDPENKQRQQYMRSLEESEMGASVAVDVVVWELLLLLVVKANSINGMLIDVWNAYKNYSSSSNTIRESETEDWIHMLLDDDGHKPLN